MVDAMKKKIVAEANVCRIETNLDLSHIRFNGKDYINADLEKSIRVKSRNELIADVLYNYFRKEKLGSCRSRVLCKYKSCTGDGACIKCEWSFGKGIYQKNKKSR